MNNTTVINDIELDQNVAWAYYRHMMECEESYDLDCVIYFDMLSGNVYSIPREDVEGINDENV